MSNSPSKMCKKNRPQIHIKLNQERKTNGTKDKLPIYLLYPSVYYQRTENIKNTY